MTLKTVESTAEMSAEEVIEYLRERGFIL